MFWGSHLIYLPTLPLYVREFTPSLSMVGVVLAMFGLGLLISRLPFCIIADTFGQHRLIILIGLILSGIGALLSGIATNIWVLLIGRVIAGISCSVSVLLTVEFNNFFPAGGGVRSTTLYLVIGCIGRLIAVSTTGFLNDLGGYRLAFYIATGLSLVAFISFWSIKPPRVNVRTSFDIKNTLPLFLSPLVILPTLIDFVSNLTYNAAPGSFMAILANRMGATNVQQSLLMDIGETMTILVSLVVYIGLAKFGAIRLIILSIGLSLAGMLGTSFATSLWQIYAMQFLLTAGVGMSYPILLGMVMDVADRSRRSTLIGMEQSLAGLGAFFGPMLGGLVADQLGIQPMFITFGITAMVITLSLLMLYKKHVDKKTVAQPGNQINTGCL